MDTPKRSSNSVSSPTDEDDHQSHQEMSFPKNSAIPPNRNYLSPEISTASKANPPRRTVLAEKNESFDSRLYKRWNLDSPKMEDEKIGYDEEGFSESPYDPVTNYLTPRPRFLRYKPGRRLEILYRVDNCLKEDGESGSGTEDESSWSEENDVNQEIEEEIEEMEEKGCGLKGFLNFFLCLMVLVLSTSYISSMNSPSPSPVVQAVTGFMNGYHVIQDHVYDFFKNFNGARYFLVQREVIQLVPTDDVGIQQELVTGIAGKNNDDLSEAVDLQRQEVDVVDMVESEGNMGLDDLVEREEEIEDLEILEDEDYPEINISELENRVLYQEPENSEVTKEVEVLITFPCCENATSIASDGNLETENEVVNELSKEEKVDKAIFTNESLTNDVESSSKLQITDSMTAMSFLMNAIGGFLLSVLAALYFQRKRNGRHGISQDLEPTFKQVQENKCSLVLTNEVDAKLKNSQSSDSSKYFLDSVGRNFNEVHHSGAPSIQLLGEFSVQEMSTSHRSYSRSDRIIGNEESPLHVHSIFSEISSMETPNQKNIETPEAYDEGKSRKADSTTPLRRSSRIRGRSIKSP